MRMIAFVTTGADISFCMGQFFSEASIDEEVWGGAPVARAYLLLPTVTCMG